jgi:hypothetical protein
LVDEVKRFGLSMAALNARGRHRANARHAAQ